MERDPSQKPKYWGMEKGVKWLATQPTVVQVTVWGLAPNVSADTHAAQPICTDTTCTSN